MSQRIAIRKVFRLGRSQVVCLPKAFVNAGEYLLLERKNDSIILRKLEVNKNEIW